MKKLNLILASIFITLLSSPIFAQSDPGGDPEAPVPINDYIWVLAVVGLVFVYFKFRSIQKNSIQG
jgi:hypothetical protein